VMIVFGPRLASTRISAITWNRVNPNCGSVAIGHPFGATGARDLS
jgi:acetyl-CoA C-acetyltransferase